MLKKRCQKSACMKNSTTGFKKLLSLITELEKHLPFFKLIGRGDHPILLSSPVLDLICKMVNIHHCFVDS